MGAARTSQARNGEGEPGEIDADGALPRMASLSLLGSNGPSSPRNKGAGSADMFAKTAETDFTSFSTDVNREWQGP